MEHLTVRRLAKAEYADSAFRGSRGRGRWHEQGTPMVYCSDQPATALSETMVHAGRADLIDESYVLFSVEIDPGAHLLKLPESELPEDWRAWPWPASTRELGTYWHEEEASLALEVPSAVVPRQRNYLVNAMHPDFEEAEMIGPEPFPVDTRLGEQEEA
jgi:RES domain-containing protein